MKRHQKLTPEGRAFLARVREVEERLFPDLLDPDHPRRLLSARRSWQYRPSHHVARGLLGAADVAALSLPGRRLLSVGAHPACLEHLLCALGVPPGNVVVGDRDPAIASCVGAMDKVVFDLFDPWPDLGRFDLVLFPESLCIALTDEAARLPSDPDLPGPFPNDARVAQLLAHVLGQALDRLRAAGSSSPGEPEIRADGPMCHPKLVRAASEALDAAGRPHRIDYDRFFLRVRASAPPSEVRFV